LGSCSAALLAVVCTAQQMLDLRQFLRIESRGPTPDVDVCANLTASTGRMHLCPSNAAVAIVSPCTVVHLQHRLHSLYHDTKEAFWFVAVSSVASDSRWNSEASTM